MDGEDADSSVKQAIKHTSDDVEQPSSRPVLAHEEENIELAKNLGALNASSPKDKPAVVGINFEQIEEVQNDDGNLTLPP